MKKVFLCIAAVVFLSLNSYTQEKFIPDLSGPYLGQKLPGPKAELFAPGIVTTHYHEHSYPSFSPDGSEVLWSMSIIGNYIYRYPPIILSSKNINGSWTIPDFADHWAGIEPDHAVFSPDGNRIYLTMNLKDDNDTDNDKKYDIWYIGNESGSWGEPVNIGPNVNTNNNEMLPTVTMDYTLYYVGHLEGVKNNYGLYRSRYIGSEYQEPELLGSNINTEEVEWTPFIAPDESYLIFASLRPGGFGRGDFYICFMLENGSFSDPVNMGETVNTHYNERFPCVSPDRTVMFFMSDEVDEDLLNNRFESFEDIKKLHGKPQNGWSDIYWIDAGIIDELKPAGVK